MALALQIPTQNTQVRIFAVHTLERGVSHLCDLLLGKAGAGSGIHQSSTHRQRRRVAPGRLESLLLIIQLRTVARSEPVVLYLPLVAVPFQSFDKSFMIQFYNTTYTYKSDDGALMQEINIHIYRSPSLDTHLVINSKCIRKLGCYKDDQPNPHHNMYPHTHTHKYTRHVPTQRANSECESYPRKQSANASN